MKFKDEVRIQVTAGSGGDGAISWRREKYVPLGGPDGGDGGNGGAIVFVADPGLNTLIDFSYSPILKAEDGSNGGSSRSEGRSGKNLIRHVPVGTQVFFNDKLVADINTAETCWVAARGGLGGKGNAFFKSSTKQAPDYAQKGQPGESYEFLLSLKSVADFGLVGLPNVGKSSLISVISSAKPEVADYPFTTIRPNLGVVFIDDTRRCVVADIPGLIPEAHLGKGLGTQFLKHIERTSGIIQVIDVTTSIDGSKIYHFDEAENLTDQLLIDLTIQQFQAVSRELELFSSYLANLKRLIVFSKADLGLAHRAQLLTKDFFLEQGFDSITVSSATGEGIANLKSKLGDLLALSGINIGEDLVC